MFRAPVQHNRGFSLIETLVAVSIFAFVSISLSASYRQVMKVAARAQTRVIIANLAAEQVEIIRNLPFNLIGTTAGIPTGVVPQIKSIARAGMTFQVATHIRNIDLPFDGIAPSDTAPEDNKIAQIIITCSTCKEPISSSFTSQFAPKDLEGNTMNGSLFIRTIDAAGQPVSGATVHVKVDPPNTVVDLTDVTGANGMLQLVGAPPAKSAYQVWVSKPGYTSDQTYSENGPTTMKPVIPHATVDTGTVTQLTFVIDKISSLSVSSLTPLCNVIKDVPFTLVGTKLIGYEPIYKFNQSFTTNALGEQMIDEIEWDTYKVTASKAGYDLVGAIPSPQFAITPGAVQALRLILIPNGSQSGQNANTMTVSVRDSISGAQMSGVNVRFEHSEETIDATTGRGQIIQTDWSSGGGQDLYEDNKAYAEDDGNVTVNAPQGAVELREVSGEYSLAGNLTSSIIDTGSASNFYDFRFSPTTQPIGTMVAFQLAAANATSGPWTYLGPDGTATSYYTATTTVISAAHNGKRFMRYKMYLSTTDVSVTPSVEDVYFSFTSSCVPPGQAYAQTIHNGSWDITISKSGYQTITDHVTIGGTVPWMSLNYALDPE